MSDFNLSPSAVADMRENATLALAAGQILINRSYLAELGTYPVQAIDTKPQTLNAASDLRIFRIERIVQANKQSVLESTTAAYTALGAAGFTVFLFLQSDGIETNLYIGVRGEPGKVLGQSAGELLSETFRGHFSGSSLLALSADEVKTVLGGVLAEKERPSSSVTAVTGVPALSTENREHFMQGLERFIDAAERREYQAIILAEPMSPQNLDLIRTGYEQVATQLSPLFKQQLSFGQQESDSVGLSISQSLSESFGESLGLTITQGYSHTLGTSTTTTKGTTESYSSQAGKSKTATILMPILGAGVGGVIAGPLGGMVGAQIGSVAATAMSKQKTTGTSESQSEGKNESHSFSDSKSASVTQSSTLTSNTTDGRSLTVSTGNNRQLSIEMSNKSIEQLLSKIDQHLKRIDEAKTYGGWSSAAYFIGDSTASSEALASIFLGLVRGSNSCHEDFALTTWNSSKKSSVLDWLGELSHPSLKPSFSKNLPIDCLTPATLVTGKELSIQLSLPRRSTSTVSVVETQAFGRKVQHLDGNKDKKVDSRNLTLGHIRHLWENLQQTIEINLDQLSSHVFISGSTGSGKSNTIFEMLKQISDAGVPFLVIEPTKGEYKHVFGHRTDVQVYGTHPAHSALLRINPFRFPAAIHVLEHVDRLVEIFNVCWPMYAAMPAVLKEAILQAYQQCGWDLELSINQYDENLFPTFSDLLLSLEKVIADSAYSQENKGNYTGALTTRVSSLTNGLNGLIFSANEIDNQLLFDGSAIIDLSRVGSSETKALIMGFLVMRLSEHRMAQGGMNKRLHHVTVLEEAHNILRRSTVESGAEGSGLMGKSVEMLSNAIAEMRTYGEGFFIVDQSPHAVDISAIRNTNTKIIMRLPDEMDRRLIGKSAGLRDEQLDEIARLPTGVAIVYQNDWLEPVLCKVNRSSDTETPYEYQLPPINSPENHVFQQQLLGLLLRSRINSPVEFDINLLEKGLSELPISTQGKMVLYETINTLKRNGTPSLFQEDAFGTISQLVTDILDFRDKVKNLVTTVENYPMLSKQLDDLIKNSVSDLSDSLRLAIQQCLMKDYSLRHESGLKIYSAWRAYIENRSFT